MKADHRFYTRFSVKEVAPRLEEFKQFITAAGAVIVPSLNDRELLRFTANNVPCVVMLAGHDEVIFINRAYSAWTAFVRNEPWHGAPQQPFLQPL